MVKIIFCTRNAISTPKITDLHFVISVVPFVLALGKFLIKINSTRRINKFHFNFIRFQCSEQSTFSIDCKYLLYGEYK